MKQFKFTVRAKMYPQRYIYRGKYIPVHKTLEYRVKYKQSNEYIG